MTNAIARPKTNTNLVLESALSLIRSGKVKLHNSCTKDVIHFRSGAVKPCWIKGGASVKSFVDKVDADEGGNFSNLCTMSLTGLITISTFVSGVSGQNNVSFAEVQSNGRPLSRFLDNWFPEESIELSEFAFHPWTTLTGLTEDQKAASFYQRRIRRQWAKDNLGEIGGREAYNYLARLILIRMMTRGTFSASREDYRSVNS